MPEETGFELLMYIRNQEKEIDIMMISAVHMIWGVLKSITIWRSRLFN